MGWDAMAITKRRYNDNGFGWIEDEYIANLFSEAVERVRDIEDTCDADLIMGGLNVKRCGIMLEKAIGESCWTYDNWAPEKVIELNKISNWDFEYDEEDRWAYLSAKEFLQTCAKCKLEIKFSW